MCDVGGRVGGKEGERQNGGNYSRQFGPLSAATGLNPSICVQCICSLFQNLNYLLQKLVHVALSSFLTELVCAHFTSVSKFLLKPFDCFLSRHDTFL